MSTKELILEEALRQFSEKGYAGTSMSEIAKPLAITKAALYKHFESKRQIFDEIIAASEGRYKEIFEKLSIHFPGEKNEGMDAKDVDVYSSITIEGLCESVLTFVRFSMNDPYSRQVRRMLTISQFQSPELGGLFTKRYVDTMLEYDRRLFEQLIKLGAIKGGDPKALASMFYAPVLMYMGIWDRDPGKAEECESAIKEHIGQFCELTKVKR